MTPSSLPLLLLALCSVLSAPTPSDGYTVEVPQKRAALVLDRLLIALQKALREGEGEYTMGRVRDGPRTSPLRVTPLSDENMMALNGLSGVSAPRDEVLDLGPALDVGLSTRHFEGPRTAPLRVATLAEDTSTLQRRGQGGGRGRVLRCYFNAVTCF